MPVIAVDVPLRGMVRDRLGSRLATGESPNLINTWREQGELRARPGLGTFESAAANAFAVLNLFDVERASGSRILMRIDEDDAWTYSAGATPSSGTWTRITAATPTFTGANTQPFGVAMSNNETILSNGLAADSVWRWTGSGNIARIAPSGLFAGNDATFRYVTTFAQRTFGAFTADTTSGPTRVIASAQGSNTDWTTANGAFIKITNEHPSYITGLTADNNTLYVWKERAVIQGLATGIADEPVVWQLLRTEGIGSVVEPRAIISYGGVWSTLSREGFYTMIGGQVQFIDADIRRDFAARLNQSALRQVFGLAMPEFGKAVWFVPEGTDPFPRNAWIYDAITGGWERWQLSIAVTAAARTLAATGRVVDSYSDPATDIVNTGDISGLIVDTVGTGGAAPVYVIGARTGQVYFLDFATLDDAGSTFGLTWESPDVRWEGLPDEAGGPSVGPLDMVTLDRVAIEYNHSGADTTAAVDVSTNGGSTWTNLQSKTLTATAGSRYVRLDFWGRVTGHQIRVRILIGSVFGSPRFRNLTLFGQRAGERR